MGSRSCAGAGGLCWAVLLPLLLGGPGCGPAVRGPGGAVKGGLVPITDGTGHPGAWEATLRPRSLALVVGLNEFDDPAWRPLRFARRDAEVLAAHLRDPAAGHFDQVLLRTAQTTRAAILDGLAELARANLDPRDAVVVYISSHGTLARDAGGELRRFLVTRDTRMREVAQTALSIDRLRQSFDSLRSLRKVLILATCHSGEGKSGLPQPVAKELSGIKSGFFVPPLEAVSHASVVIGVCGFGETAREDEGLGHDIYTYFLLEALRTGDRNGDGAVTVTEAHEHAREQTYYFTEGRQRPYVESDILGQDPIVLSGRITRAGQPAIFSFDPRHDRATLWLDGATKGALPGAFVVEPGEHQLRVDAPDGHVLAEQRVTLREGQQLDLGQLDRAPGALAPRAEHHPWVGLRGGYLATAGSARDLLASAWQAGVQAGWPGPAPLLLTGTVTLIDTPQRSSLAGRNGATATVPCRRQEVGLGLGLGYGWRLSDRFTAVAGPELELLHLRRTFELPGLAREEAQWTVSPGLGGALGLLLFAHFELRLGLSGRYLPVQVDGGLRHLVRGQLSLGTDWRF